MAEGFRFLYHFLAMSLVCIRWVRCFLGSLLFIASICLIKTILVHEYGAIGSPDILSTLTTHFDILLALRFCAGAVGGTTMGVGMSILINYAPANLRGKMLATVIASFSLVSIVGMPAILFLCTHYGWHTAPGLISSLCLLSLPLIIFIIPKDTAPSGVKRNLSIDAQTLLFASCTALVQFSPC